MLGTLEITPEADVAYPRIEGVLVLVPASASRKKPAAAEMQTEVCLAVSAQPEAEDGSAGTSAPKETAKSTEEKDTNLFLEAAELAQKTPNRWGFEKIQIVKQEELAQWMYDITHATEKLPFHFVVTERLNAAVFVAKSSFVPVAMLPSEHPFPRDHIAFGPLLKQSIAWQIIKQMCLSPSMYVQGKPIPFFMSSRTQGQGFLDIIEASTQLDYLNAQQMFVYMLPFAQSVLGALTTQAHRFKYLSSWNNFFSTDTWKSMAKHMNDGNFPKFTSIESFLRDVIATENASFRIKDMSSFSGHPRHQAFFATASCMVMSEMCDLLRDIVKHMELPPDALVKFIDEAAANGPLPMTWEALAKFLMDRLFVPKTNAQYKHNVQTNGFKGQLLLCIELLNTLHTPQRCDSVHEFIAPHDVSPGMFELLMAQQIRHWRIRSIVNPEFKELQQKRQKEVNDIVNGINAENARRTAENKKLAKQGKTLLDLLDLPSDIKVFAERGVQCVPPLRDPTVARYLDGAPRVFGKIKVAFDEDAQRKGDHLGTASGDEEFLFEDTDNEDDDDFEPPTPSSLAETELPEDHAADVVMEDVAVEAVESCTSEHADAPVQAAEAAVAEEEEEDDDEEKEDDGSSSDSDEESSDSSDEEERKRRKKKRKLAKKEKKRLKREKKRAKKEEKRKKKKKKEKKDKKKQKEKGDKDKQDKESKETKPSEQKKTKPTNPTLQTPEIKTVTLALSLPTDHKPTPAPAPAPAPKVADPGPKVGLCCMEKAGHSRCRLGERVASTFRMGYCCCEAKLGKRCVAHSLPNAAPSLDAVATTGS